MAERKPLDPRRIWPSILTFLTFGLVILAGYAVAQTEQALPPPSALKKMSIEQLMDVEVTAVSKRPERLSETASAIQVITQDLPAKVSRQWFSAFGQDEIAIEEADWTGIADGEK